MALGTSLNDRQYNFFKPASIVTFTGTKTLVSGAGVFEKVHVTATSTGVIKVFDGTTGVGTPVILYDYQIGAGSHDMGRIAFTNGLHLGVVSGSITGTATYKQ